MSASAVKDTAGSKVMMCRPVHYGVDYVINPWMMGQAVDRELARRQFDKLVETYEGIGLAPTFVSAEPHLPDMVFTANAGLILGSKFVPSNFRYAQRQPERDIFRRHFIAEGYTIADIRDELFFEGAGDALYLGDELVLGYGFRSAQDVAEELVRIAPSSPVLSLGLSNPYYYHLDTCFSPLPSGRFVYYPDAFDDRSRTILKERGGYWVTEDFCVRYGCNMVAVDDVIVTTCVDERFKEIADRENMRVIEVDLSEFLKAGGGARCLSFIY